MIDNRFRRSGPCYLSLFDQDSPVAKGQDRPHIMADKKHGTPTVAGDVLHLPDTAVLKLGIADRQHFIHDENFRIQVCRYRKSQTHVHPR